MFNGVHTSPLLTPQLPTTKDAYNNVTDQEPEILPPAGDAGDHNINEDGFVFATWSTPNPDTQDSSTSTSHSTSPWRISSSPCEQPRLNDDSTKKREAKITHHPYLHPREKLLYLTARQIQEIRKVMDSGNLKYDFKKQTNEFYITIFLTIMTRDIDKLEAIDDNTKKKLQEYKNKFDFLFENYLEYCQTQTTPSPNRVDFYKYQEEINKEIKDKLKVSEKFLGKFFTFAKLIQAEIIKNPNGHRKLLPEYQIKS